MTDILAAKFKLSKIEVLTAYEQFYRNFPEGFILKEDYMEENKVYCLSLLLMLKLYLLTGEYFG